MEGNGEPDAEEDRVDLIVQQMTVRVPGSVSAALTEMR